MNFILRNMADHDIELWMDFNKFYLIDQQGETYQPRKRDIIPEARSTEPFTFRAGTKTRFWMEFEAPKKPETKFKVFPAGWPYASIQNYANEFTPFVITLKEPISAKLAESAAPLDKPGPGKPDAEGLDLAQAMRDLAKDSKRFEGASVTAKGVKEAIAVAFLPDPDDEEGVIAHITPIRTPLSKTILQGWVMPDVTTPSGLVIKMVKSPGTTYRFSLNVKGLAGTDNKGGKYTLTPVK